MTPTIVGDCSQVLRRKSTTIDYIVSDGWHCLVICEDEDEEGFDPWLAFLQGLAFAVDEYFTAYDEGLLTFIASGAGEEWRLVDLGEASSEGWTPDEGWNEVDLNVDNMMEFMPRMGYLFTDGVFDLERVAAGKQKFVLRDGGEGVNKKEGQKPKYNEYKFSMKVGDEWLGAGEGFEDVELTETMMVDLEINPEFQKEVKLGEKKIVGKI